MYFPSEDSYLLSETLNEFLKKKYNDKGIAILDMGSGMGIQAETCRKAGFRNILTADIDKESVALLKEKGFKAVKSDLFSRLNKKKFNLIIFNPPYLPASEYDKEKDTTGGKEGYETILEFLKQAKKHLEKNSSILLLFSSLSSPKIIKQKARKLNYRMKILARKKMFFEELFVAELKKSSKKTKKRKKKKFKFW